MLPTALVLLLIALALILIRTPYLQKRLGKPRPAPSARPAPRPVRAPQPAAPSENPVLASVADPGAAAAVLLYSLAAEKGPVSPEAEQHIEELLEAICLMTEAELNEAISFAAWSAIHVRDSQEVIRRFLPLWTELLPPTERDNLLGMAAEVVEMDGPPTTAQEQALRRLRDGLATV